MAIPTPAEYGHAETRERLAALEVMSRAHGATLDAHARRMDGQDARANAQADRMNVMASKHALLDGIVRTQGRVLEELGKLPAVLGEIRQQSAFVQSSIKYGAAAILGLLTLTGRVSGDDAGRLFGWFFGQ